YRVQAIFMSAYRPYQWIPQEQRRLMEATEAQEEQAKEAKAKSEAAVAALRKQATDLQQQYRERLLAERLARLPAAIRHDARAALAIAPSKQNEVQKCLAGKFQKELRPDPAALNKALADQYLEYRAKSQALDAAIKAEEARRPKFLEIR